MSSSEYYTILDASCEEGKLLLALDYANVEIEAWLYSSVRYCEAVFSDSLDEIVSVLMSLKDTVVYISDASDRFFISDGEDEVYCDLPVVHVSWSLREPSSDYWKSRLRRLYRQLSLSEKEEARYRRLHSRILSYLDAKVPDAARRLDERILFHSTSNLQKSMYEEGRRDMLLDIEKTLRELIDTTEGKSG